MKKIITIIIIIAFAVNSAGQGYALRPMATSAMDQDEFRLRIMTYGKDKDTTALILKEFAVAHRVMVVACSNCGEALRIRRDVTVTSVSHTVCYDCAVKIYPNEAHLFRDSAAEQTRKRELINEYVAPKSSSAVETTTTMPSYSFITNESCERGVNTFRVTGPDQAIVEGGFLMRAGLILYDETSRVGAVAHINLLDSEIFDPEIAKYGIKFMIDRIKNKAKAKVNIKAFIIHPEYINNQEYIVKMLPEFSTKEDALALKMLSLTNVNLLTLGCLLNDVAFDQFTVPTNSFMFNSSNGTVLKGSGGPTDITMDSTAFTVKIASFAQINAANLPSASSAKPMAHELNSHIAIASAA